MSLAELLQAYIKLGANVRLEKEGWLWLFKAWHYNLGIDMAARESSIEQIVEHMSKRLPWITRGLEGRHSSDDEPSGALIRASIAQREADRRRTAWEEAISWYHSTHTLDC